ncbi:MAG: hypothetical protein ACRDVL_08470, partial [Acidimicrobiia bacterium]
SESTNLISDGNYRLVIVKQGSGDLANKLHWNVTTGQGLPPAQNAPGFSHYITCTVPATPTTEATTTTTEGTTTTTEGETTTTGAETTTTEATTTTTSTIPDEVLGTTITTSTTSPTIPVTTVPDEVLETEVEAEELPFTGIESDLLVGMAVLLLMGGLLVLALTGRREDT